ncbi:membrane protein insertion efficiency factor YidD [Leucobacter sp. GX24907]
MTRLLLDLWLLPRNVAIAVMQIYRRLISPLYGEVCRYYPSCSRYSLESYQQRGFLFGLVLTIWRLLRCNPWSRGGIDDVPAPRSPRFQTNSRGFVRPIDRKA